MSAPTPVVGERPWIVVAIVLAATVHIVSILAMPRVAPRDAFQRFAAVAALNAFVALPRAAPGSEIVPFNDPAAAMGVCRYDLGTGPLHVRGKLVGDNFMSLAFHSRQGKIFNSLTDKAATRGEFDVFVLTPDQLTALEAKDSGDEPPKELRIVSPTRRGFVFARALSPLPSAYAEAVEQIAALSCAVEQPESP